MARHVEGPWYRESKGCWCATVAGRKVSLRVKGRGNRTEATKAWHRLMAGSGVPEPAPVQAAPAPAPTPTASPTVGSIVANFLISRKGRVKDRTLYVYGCLLKKVTAEFGKRTADRMKGHDVLQWLAHLPLSRSTRSDIAGVLASAFKWAEEEQLIERNPLRGMKRPSGESRGTKALITPQTHQKLLDAAPPAFRTFLTLLHQTGARPSELAAVTAENLDLPNNLIVLTTHKTAHVTGKPRIVFLSPAARELLSTQAVLHPKGSLLRNAKGLPWTKDGIVLAMRRTSAKAGVKATAYGYRHTYATDALAAGVPDAQVAALLGHSSTAMLHKHYSHLSEQTKVLAAAAKVVR